MQQENVRRGKATHHHSMVWIALRSRSGLMCNQGSEKIQRQEIQVRMPGSYD
jgi:hypothetical protein